MRSRLESEWFLSKKTGSGFEVLDGTPPPKFPLSALGTF